MEKPATIVINNFGGRLTRILNGDMNSGFAKFDTSFGYDPFTKPMNLSWLEQSQSITGISDVVMGGITKIQTASFNTSIVDTYLVGTTGKMYWVRTNDPGNTGSTIDSVLAVTSVTGTFNFGAGMAFFGNREKLYLGSDTNIISTGSVNGVGVFALDGSSSIIGNSSFISFSPKPMQKFAGKLIFGNGATIGAIDNTGTITSSIIGMASIFGNKYSELNPPLPFDQTIRDLDVTVDNNYLQMSSSNTPAELAGAALLSNSLVIDNSTAFPGEGSLFKWNGVDQAVTTALTIPGGNLESLQTYFNNEMLFITDGFGLGVADTTRKHFTLMNNKAPLANATDVNGNYVCWMNPEVTDGSSKRVASLYYFGSLDDENPVGLYRVLRYEAPIAGGYVFQVPYQALVTNKYVGVSNSVAGVTVRSWGKHYFSTFNVSSSVLNSSAVGAASLNRFFVTSRGNGIPQLGVYETQTQLFSKRTGLSQIRVYTEPVVAGNGFQLDVIGVDGTPVDNGTFTYTFGDPVDKEERINFNPGIAPQYGMGIRITNTGTTNMTIKKVELDVSPEGK